MRGHTSPVYHTTHPIQTANASDICLESGKAVTRKCFLYLEDKLELLEKDSQLHFHLQTHWDIIKIPHVSVVLVHIVLPYIYFYKILTMKDKNHLHVW